MNTLTPLMIAALLAVSAPFAQAQEKPVAAPAAVAASAPATVATADIPTANVPTAKTRAQVRAELDEARRRGELEPGHRWGVDTRNTPR
jgi:hypothetical protein